MIKRPDVKIVRIFLASPGDVTAERAKAVSAIDELNRGLAAYFGLRLECMQWEQYVAPVMGRPEQVILDQLSIEDTDIFVGILWHRFGSPTGSTNPVTNENYLSGTEEEFDVAYRLWQDRNVPEILFYQCTRGTVNLADIVPDQLNKVLQFVDNFSHGGRHPGFVRKYQTPEEFERRFREDLSILIKKFSPTSRGHDTELNMRLNNHGFLNIFLPIANEERDDSKIIALRKSKNIRLIAHSGFSYLALVGHRFRHIIEEMLSNGGTLRVVLINPWSETGLFIALAEQDANSEHYKSLIRHVYDRAGFEGINPREIIETSSWYSIKFRDSMQGYERLKAKYGSLIEIRYWLYAMPATILLTEFECYWEPYLNVNLQERLKRELLTYELRIDTRAELYQHATNYFDFLWRLSMAERDFKNIESTLKNELNTVPRSLHFI